MPTPLPPLTMEEIERELTMLLPARRVMITHLLNGLTEEISTLSSRAFLRELVHILVMACAPSTLSIQAEQPRTSAISTGGPMS